MRLSTSLSEVITYPFQTGGWFGAFVRKSES